MWLVIHAHDAIFARPMVDEVSRNRMDMEGRARVNDKISSFSILVVVPLDGRSAADKRSRASLAPVLMVFSRTKRSDVIEIKCRRVVVPILES